MQIKTTTKHIVEMTMDELIDAIRQLYKLEGEVELRIVDATSDQSDPVDRWTIVPSNWEHAHFPLPYQHSDDEIVVRLRNGSTQIGSVGRFDYSQEDTPYDVVAYRLMK